MNYKFICPYCNERTEIDMKMSNYTSKGHLCEKCNSELIRDINDFGTSFDTSKIGGFCGKCGE